MGFLHEPRIEFKWYPSHVKIERNETCDGIAKRAANMFLFQPPFISDALAKSRFKEDILISRWRKHAGSLTYRGHSNMLPYMVRDSLHITHDKEGRPLFHVGDGTQTGVREWVECWRDMLRTYPYGAYRATSVSCFDSNMGSRGTRGDDAPGERMMDG